VTPLEKKTGLVENAGIWINHVESTDRQVVTAHAVRAQLDRILAAEMFASAGRISRLLRYVVERTMAGDGPQLKEYVLGIDVFDRDEAYDPRLDSIVRVEVRRLRARLDEYYRGPGTADPVVITIPRGAYAPVFSPAAPLPPAGRAAADATPRVGPDAADRAAHAVRALTAVGFFAVVLTAILAAAVVSRRSAVPAAEASTVRSIAVLPFEHYSIDAADTMTAARLTDSVTTELARLGTLSVVSRTTASRYAGRSGALREIAKGLDADFVMESTVTIEGSHLWVVARLVSGPRDRKVWVGEYDAPVSAIGELSRRIAVESAAGALHYDLAH
jgi:adenylate cyclase